MTTLIDTLGRHIHYLRISVTDRCDYRCVYCMSEKMEFLPRADILTLEEITQIARVFVGLGVTKIRLTGGEPLIRSNITSLCESISSMSGLRELTMTTNGSRLTQFAQSLFDSGVSRLNVSLDSLDATRFHDITRVGNVEEVVSGIHTAKQVGFKKIKINCVMMKNRNDQDILPLVEFAINNELDISFIEEMPLGKVTEHDRAITFMSSAEVREVIGQHYALVPSAENTGGPSRYWRVVNIKNTNTRIGFISPHSHNFCEACNRVRLTADGRLLLCLGNEHSVDLKRVLRTQGEDALVEAIINSMQIKPARHYFNVHEEPQIVRFMNMTGG